VPLRGEPRSHRSRRGSIPRQGVSTSSRRQGRPDRVSARQQGRPDRVSTRRHGRPEDQDPTAIDNRELIGRIFEDFDNEVETMRAWLESVERRLRRLENMYR
jgi:hypothetical protein